MITPQDGQYYWVRDKYGFVTVGRFGNFHYGDPGWYIVGSEVPFVEDEVLIVFGPLEVMLGGFEPYRHY